MFLGLTATRKNYKHHQHVLVVTAFFLGAPGTDMLGGFGQVACPFWMLVFSLVKLEDWIESVVLSLS